MAQFSVGGNTHIIVRDARASFDSIRVRSPEVARAFLTLIVSQPEFPLVMFAPRWVGKTFFLNEDMVPIAQSAGLLAIYCDIWLNKSTPIGAITNALEEALDDLTVPFSYLGDEQQRRPLPDIPAFRLDAWLGRVVAKHGSPLLFMLDEVQAFGIHPNCVELLSALRAALTKHKGKVFEICTGSSQADLTKMFSMAGAPMYGYAQKGDFPYLRHEYLEALPNHFSTVHPRKIVSVGALGDLFKRIEFKPALLRDIAKPMSSEGVFDPDGGFQLFINDPQQVEGWRSSLERLNVHDRLVLLALARKMPPYSKQTSECLQRALGKGFTTPKISSSIDRLIKEKLEAKREAGYIVDDESFSEYLLQNDQHT